MEMQAFDGWKEVDEMAAPSGIKWGSTVGSYGRIGIYVGLTNVSNTQTKRHTEIWFWSKYAVNDSSNTFYYDDQATTATTSKGSVNIKTSVSSGSGWSISNQVQIAEYDYTFNRGTSASKKNVAAKLTGIDRVGGTMTCTTSYTIPAKPSYTVKYNANGGSGAPGNQTKWYGTTLKLSSTKPTRTGYTFQGWSTKNDSSVEYASGANYTANAAVTLYAVWKANTYTVSYNANGGSGAPSSQTKIYGVDLTLSSIIPTRTNYNFLGWGTSAGATTIAYAPGATYTGNVALSLYAIWEVAYTPPRIEEFAADRCMEDGTLSDDGTYVRVVFDWALDETYSDGIQAIMIGYKAFTAESYTEIQVSAAGMSGSISAIIGNGTIDTEYAYDILITVTDNKGSSNMKQTIAAFSYTIDLLAGGEGVAFGRPAYRKGVDIYFDTMIDKENVVKCDDADFLGFQDDKSPMILNHIGLTNGKWLQGQLPTGDFLDVLRMNENGEVELNWTSSGLKGRAHKLLWSGSWSSGSITISELPYYNFFLFGTSGLTMIPVYRYMGVNGRGSELRGTGMYPYLSQSKTRGFYIYGFAGTISSDTKLTMTKAHQYSIYDDGGNPSNRSDSTITHIYGVM
mgnify:FL=1